MRNFCFIFCVLLGLTVLVSCSESKSDNDTLTVSTEVINIPAEGGSATFKISCTTSWNVICDNEAIWLSQTQGKGDGEIEIAMGATSFVKASESRIMVRADNGTTRNIQVNQAGIWLSGTTLTVTNKAGIIAFNGKAHDIDSLMVLANTPWVLYGPEWIEVLDGEKWVALSPTTAMLRRNADANFLTSNIKLRTARELNELEDVFDDLYLKPAYDENVGVKLQVTQLGKHSANPNVSVIMAYGMACDWKVGNDVSTIFYKFSKEVLPASELTSEAIETWTKTTPTSLSSRRNLEENTTYYLYHAGKGNGPIERYRVSMFSTLSASNQALAPISNVVNNGESWSYDVRLGSNCKSYVKLTTTNSTYFNQFESALAWRINRWMHDDATTNKYPLYAKSLRWTYKTTDPLLIVTWGAGHDGNNMASVLSRYLTSEHSAAPNRSMTLKDDGPDDRSDPIDMEEFKRSVMIIK